MNNKNKIIIISGPTASGKTKTSVNLATKLGGEIINFDSLVFYKELTIGTAKPTQKEMNDIPHHLVGTHSIYSPLNAADFIKEAVPIINRIHERNKTVFLVGGSGFYLQALLHGMYDSPTTSEKILNQSETLYLKQGITPFLKILKDEDLESFERYHENDHYRIRRAVEHFWQTGQRFSTSRKKMQTDMNLTPIEKYEWDLFHLYLDIDKEEHFKIIQKRSQTMLKNGLIEEVRAILSKGADGSEKPLNSIGYKETISYIRGDFPSIEAYLERLNINTRRLAKSQRTWFKKVEKKSYNPLTDQDILLSDCNNFLEN